jgi:FkbM family methyltransferase
MSFSIVRYHHIGGRGGKFPINIPMPLRDSVCLTLYDADSSCIEEIKAKISNENFMGCEVLPYCLSGQEGKTDFIITKQPHNSSLLPPNSDVYNYIRNSPKFGSMRLGEMLTPHSVEKLDTVLLSTVIKNEDKPNPDFISLDIQGAEYDVIFASQHIFKEALLINLEAMFLPMYQNQKTFPDIHNLMTNLGFVMVDLQLYDPHHLCRTPLDFSAKGFLMDGEAFYIKKPDLDNWSLEKILKYCFAAILCHQTHLCIKIFELFDEKYLEEISSLELEEAPSYILLIMELYEAHKKANKYYLPFFHKSRVYQTYHQSDSEEKTFTPTNEIKQEIALNGHYNAVLKKYGLDSFADEVKENEHANISSLKLMEREFL